MKNERILFKPYAASKLNKSTKISNVNITSNIFEEIQISDPSGFVKDVKILNIFLEAKYPSREIGLYRMNHSKLKSYKVLGIVTFKQFAYVTELICVEFEKGKLIPIYIKVIENLKEEYLRPHTEPFFNGYFLLSGMNKVFRKMTNTDSDDTGCSIIHSSLSAITFFYDRLAPNDSEYILGDICPDVNTDVLSSALGAAVCSSIFLDDENENDVVSMFLDETENILYPFKVKNLLKSIDMTANLMSKGLVSNLNSKCKIDTTRINIENPDYVLDVNDLNTFNIVSDLMTFIYDNFKIEFITENSSLIIHEMSSSSEIFLSGINQEYIKHSFMNLFMRIIDKLNISGNRIIKEDNNYVFRSRRSGFQEDIVNGEPIMKANSFIGKIISIVIEKNSSEDVVIRIMMEDDIHEIYLDLILLSILNPKLFYDSGI